MIVSLGTLLMKGYYKSGVDCATMQQNQYNTFNFVYCVLFIQ